MSSSYLSLILCSLTFCKVLFARIPVILPKLLVAAVAAAPQLLQILSLALLLAATQEAVYDCLPHTAKLLDSSPATAASAATVS